MDSKIQKFDIKAFIEEIESLDNITEYKRLRSMWRSVIYQALIDLNSRSTSKRGKSYKIKARRFFFGSREDFHLTCQHASLNPQVVLNKARNILRGK